MQLFALSDDVPIYAQEASKEADYKCPECGGVLRLKAGQQRQKHFYHLRKSPYCRQSSKSQTHIELQNYLLKMLPKGSAQMEKHFPSINRIADVFWLSKNIVFEIQCSAISEKEARERCKDYESLGLKVVWLLSDKLFNKKRVKESESYLRKKLAYFFSIEKNLPLIYDQWEIFRGSFRVFTSNGLPVLLNWPLTLPEKFHQSPFAQLREESELYFQGDLLGRVLENPASALALNIKREAESPQKAKKWKNPFTLIWEMLLRLGV